LLSLKLFNRAVVVILALIALAGCASGPRHQATPQTSFDAQSADGLVVIGMKGTGPRITNAIGLETAYPGFSLTWIRTEKNADGMWDAFVTVPRLANIGNVRDLNYTAYTVPPGRSFLNSVTVVQTSGNLITTRRITLRRDPAIGFEVKAGEIAYIGDMAIDAIGSPPQIERAGHDDQAAAAAIKLYGKLKGDLHYVPLAPVRVTGEPVLYPEKN
jgi:hypothetical protein